MAKQETTPGDVREPSYADAITPLVVLLCLVAGSIALFGLSAIDGPMQVALLLSAMVASIIIRKNGHTWEAIADAGGKAVSSVSSAIFILLSVGALIGAWNLSGTIPTMVYFGIRLLDPNYFYIASALICGVTSLAIGSSWTTAGTIGVGLVGVASLVGVSPYITAGAVISGAYLGDKLSPLSETTILTAQLVGVELYTHIRWMLWTAGPAFLIALVGFALLAGRDTVVQEVQTASELARLDELFWITPLNLIPLIVLVLLSIRKAPPSLAIMGAALLAGVMAAIAQPQAVSRFVGEPTLAAPVAAVKATWMAIANGYQESSGIPDVDRLLSRGGMDSMLPTLWIIIGAVTFGTLLEEFGLLAKVINPILERVSSVAGLIGAVVATAIGLNIVAADQYVALVLPARLFRVEFQKRGLAAQNLSRTCADAGTVTSPLVPWNSCAAYMAGTLGIPTLLYLPFCFFNIACPMMALFYGITGVKIERMRHAGAPGEPVPGWR